MPHFHISLQAGNNLILKRMKRRHTREMAISFCNKVLAIRKEATFGADLITGFPTETHKMFKDTLNLVDECHLTHLHVFPYSARDNTPAARPALPSSPAPASQSAPASTAQCSRSCSPALKTALSPAHRHKTVVTSPAPVTRTAAHLAAVASPLPPQRQQP